LGTSKTALAFLQAIAEAIALRFFKQLALNLRALDGEEFVPDIFTLKCMNGIGEIPIVPYYGG